VVIPVFNEASVVGDVVRAVRGCYPTVVCVDDGSNDASSTEVRDAGAILVKHPLNLGQGAALRTGLEFGLSLPGIRWFVTFDADGQHDVVDIGPMLDLLDKGQADIVFGSRFLDERTQVTRARRFVLGLAVRYSKASTGMALTDTHNGLRAFSRDVAVGLDLQMNGMAHASELLHLVSHMKARYAEVPVHITYSDYSKAKGQPLMNAVNILFDLILR
jgi:glycosyltransferase involved in cell wall biosynthesis